MLKAAHFTVLQTFIPMIIALREMNFTRKDRFMAEKKIWAEPEVRELDVRETRNDPGIGGDIPINPDPNSTFS